jgi:ParB family chromosome partitioning protein
MRADAHFVDDITSARHGAVGRMVSISEIDANPDQPRKEMTRIEELAESIREKGILEPILVRPTDNDRYEIIAGERRFLAARKVGLQNVPCVEVDVDDRGSLEISLIENLQRSELTPFEEAEAIARLVEEFDYTHAQISRKMGRARSSITEILSLNRLPASVKDACRRADITTKSTLMEIVRQPDEESMLELVRLVAEGRLPRDAVRDWTRQRSQEEARTGGGRSRRPRPFVFQYKPPEKGFSVRLRFEDQQDVAPEHLLSALEEIVSDLRREISEGRDPRQATGAKTQRPKSQKDGGEASEPGTEDPPKGD